MTLLEPLSPHSPVQGLISGTKKALTGHQSCCLRRLRRTFHQTAVINWRDTGVNTHFRCHAIHTEALHLINIWRIHTVEISHFNRIGAFSAFNHASRASAASSGNGLSLSWANNVTSMPTALASRATT